MRIQAKLFILLFVISVLPLVALSWRGERATENLGTAIAEGGKEAVTTEIKSQLQQAIGYSSALLSAEERLVEVSLRLQAAEAERLLAGTAAGGAPVHMHTDFDDPARWPPGTELAFDHVTVT